MSFILSLSSKRKCLKSGIYYCFVCLSVSSAFWRINVFNSKLAVVTVRQTDGRHAVSIRRYALVHRAVKIGPTYTPICCRCCVCVWASIDDEL